MYTMVSLVHTEDNCVKGVLTWEGSRLRVCASASALTARYCVCVLLQDLMIVYTVGFVARL